MTLYNNRTFSVPATGQKTDKPCAVHHFVKGQCLRCPEKIRETVPTTSEGDE